WAKIISLRDAVNRHCEAARNEKLIKANLSATVTLYGDAALAEFLKPIFEELRFVLIVSELRLRPLIEKPADLTTETLPTGEALAVHIAACTAPKCERCWHQQADVGSHAAHPTLCGRCIENIDGAGETRSFA
ncbi:MAG: zinc finger domain-containing protein, partial [Halothiobacillus sp.]